MTDEYDAQALAARFWDNVGDSLHSLCESVYAMSVVAELSATPGEESIVKRYDLDEEFKILDDVREMLCRLASGDLSCSRKERKSLVLLPFTLDCVQEAMDEFGTTETLLRQLDAERSGNKEVLFETIGRHRDRSEIKENIDAILNFLHGAEAFSVGHVLDALDREIPVPPAKLSRPESEPFSRAQWYSLNTALPGDRIIADVTAIGHEVAVGYFPSAAEADAARALLDKHEILHQISVGEKNHRAAAASRLLSKYAKADIPFAYEGNKRVIVMPRDALITLTGKRPLSYKQSERQLRDHPVLSRELFEPFEPERGLPPF